MVVPGLKRGNVSALINRRDPAERLNVVVLRQANQEVDSIEGVRATHYASLRRQLAFQSIDSYGLHARECRCDYNCHDV